MAYSDVQSLVFADVDEKSKVTVVPRTITQTEQIARYFTEDLQRFVSETGIDLIEKLQIPDEPGYPQAVDEVIEMLYDDISHLVRDELITGINILISDSSIDPNLMAHTVRYHALYTIQTVGRSLIQEDAQRFGGYLAPPSGLWRSGQYRFDLLIDWNATANEKRRWARRPEYCFDWVPEQESFNASNLICYREGGLTMDGATIVNRRESASADAHET